MKKLIIISILCGGIGFSQTVISGELSGYLTAESSPYYMVQSCEVLESLVIEPGVEIFVYSGDITLTIYGSIYANGTEELPIAMTGFSGEWTGIEFWGLDAVGVFSHFELANTYQNAIAVRGNSYEANFADITLTHCNIHDTGWSYGINIRDACDMNITDSEINNGLNVYIQWDSADTPVTIDITETVVRNLGTQQYGFNVSWSAGDLLLNISNCIIEGFNGYGVSFENDAHHPYGSYAVSILSSLIKNNGGGIEIIGESANECPILIGNNTIVNCYIPLYSYL